MIEKTNKTKNKNKMKKKYKDMNDLEKIEHNVKIATRNIKIIIVLLFITYILQVIVFITKIK